MNEYRTRSVSLNFVLALYAGLIGAVFLLYQLKIAVPPESFGTIVGVVSTLAIALCVLMLYTPPVHWIVRVYVGLGILNALTTAYFGVTRGTEVGLILSSISGVVMMFVVPLRDA